MIILGIDPGASGAICAIHHDGTIQFQRLDASERDIADFLGERSLHGIHGYLERVHSMPGQGVSSAFGFGQSYGFLRGLLVGLEIAFEEVTPQRWQKAMGCARPQGVKESQTEHKNRTKARAQQLFPQLKITHAIADALLIAEFGRRLRAGEFSK